ncbi:FAD-binding oxidoreductase [Neptuniibacter sp. QD29_5]|uniref:FAD-binding oxidoreductase n=1 Tax=Neptuniibacter sp. QD29_5 TaxID=3398207 RepID=UPI0039F50210
MSNVSASYPIVSYPCQVVKLAPLSTGSIDTGTFDIELQSPAGTKLNYHAGQYLQLDLDVNGDGQLQTLSYTIASSPDSENPRRLQLFIQNGSEFADKVLNCLSQHLENQTSLNVTLAMGKAFLQTDLTQPHLLIAASSGISKIKSITEEILRRKPDAEVNIYWSNKRIEEFYLLEQFQAWADQNANLSFTPILESPNANWNGRTGFIYEVVSKDDEALESTQTYLCGSPNMVYGTIDQLESKGLKEENCYSDVFEFAPRGQKAAI